MQFQLFLVVLVTLLAITTAQRPSYAGTSLKGYPELASRFGGPDSAADDNVRVANRIGEQDGPTPKIPTDARGDVALVNRLNQWPRDNRPFWLLNSDHIEKQRRQNGQQRIGQQNQQSTTLKAIVTGSFSGENFRNQQAAFVDDDDDFGAVF